MMDNLERIKELEAEIENLEDQMQREIVAIDNKRSLFFTEKKKEKKISEIISFYSSEIAKKKVDIDELSDDLDDDGDSLI